MSKAKLLQQQVQLFATNEFDFKYLEEVTTDILENREKNFVQRMFISSNVSKFRTKRNDNKDGQDQRLL